MNELVERRAAIAGIAVVRAAAGAIPVFCSKEGPADKARPTMGAKAGPENPIAVLRDRSMLAAPHKAPLYRRSS